MSEEEKELVNNCKLWVTEEDINYTRWFGLDDLSVLVNLIEKQQKEIENSISKDKIRKINKDLQDKYNKSVDNVYQNPTEALIEFQRLVGKLELIQELLEN